jgi:hypothetical protein
MRSVTASASSSSSSIRTATSWSPETVDREAVRAHQAQPSSFIAQPAFQIFVMCLIFPSSKSMT